MHGTSKAGKRIGLLCAGLLLSVITASAIAQPPPGGGGPGGRQGRGPGGFGRMGMGGGGVVNTPISALEYGLKLTAKQKTDIVKIQTGVREQMRSLFQPPQGGGQPGGPPNFEAMRQNFEKMRELNERESKKIEAMLTPAQKKALPGLLKDVQTLNQTSIPVELMGELKLTADQMKQLTAIAEEAQKQMREKMQEAQQSGNFGAMREMMQQMREETEGKAESVLTDDQRVKVAQYKKDHPQRPGGFGFGGPGGPGGPRPGGPGGPPPNP